MLVENLIIPSSFEQLAVVDTVTERIARELGFDTDACSDLGICVTEAVNNAIVHANKMRPELNVEILFETVDSGLRVTVRDFGSGFDVESIPDPTLPENLFKSGGRGVHVMKSLMDNMDFIRLADGMKLILTKKLARTRP
jgi:serine/threonine-protein kinase RsbW